MSIWILLIVGSMVREAVLWCVMFSLLSESLLSGVMLCGLDKSFRSYFVVMSVIVVGDNYGYHM